MNTNKVVNRDAQRHTASRPILTGLGVALVATLASVAEARAATYQVDTSTAASSMTITNDGKCTLAEAVQLFNNPKSPITDCTDQAVGSTDHRVELLQAPNKPYASNHFKITSFTITTSTPISFAGYGGAVIDSSFGNNLFAAFVIGVSGKPATQASVFFNRVILTNSAGINGGRLIENYGTLSFFGVTFSNGDVSGSRHVSGRGGAIYNAGLIYSAENSLLTGNKAKRGGAIYNDASGVINELFLTISGNTATMAGGGLYNVSGTIITGGLHITGNKAVAGGGVFNRGKIEMYDGCVVSNNSASGTGSGENCALGQSCDGAGGGVLSMHALNAPETRFNLSIAADLSNNTAAGLGGAIYAVGVLDLGGMTINGNKALNGGAIYWVHPGDGTQAYCHIAGDDGGVYGPTSITNNTATSAQGYSIVAGDSDGVASGTPGPTPVRCNFAGRDRVHLTASGNSPLMPVNATRCQPSIVDTDNSSCPQ
jgi:predicted outer membrane repeat protein